MKAASSSTESRIIPKSSPGGGFVSLASGYAEDERRHLIRVRTPTRSDYTLANQAEPSEPPTVSAPSREEIDAKLEAIEARMDGRVASIGSKIDSLSSELRAQSGITEGAFAAIGDKFSRIEVDIAASRVESKEQFRWLAGLLIGSALAIFFGMVSVNTGLVSAFQTGLGAADAKKDDLNGAASALSSAAAELESARKALEASVQGRGAAKEQKPDTATPAAK